MQPGSSSRRAQAPTAQQRRAAPAAVALLLALLLALLAAAVSGADAALSVCAATAKPVCPAKAPPNPFDAARKPMSKQQQPVVKTAAVAPATAAAAAAATSPRQVLPRDVTASLLTAMGSRKERMFIPHLAQQQQPGGRGRPATDMPQRVLPSGSQPVMSVVAQQQLFTQLLGVLQGPAGINTSNSSKAAGGSLKPARRHRKRKTPATTAVMVSSVEELQQDSSEPGVVFLRNARLQVGVDTNRGGALTHLSSPVMPPEWAGVNLINTWDAGRLVQQSYYGCYDGTCWVDRPWRWNPVQGGSWQNGPPQLLASSVGAASVTTASVPRNWGGQELLEDVLMVTQTQLLQNVVKVRFTMRYAGTALHPEAHQELPAVFVHRRLNVLAMYTGQRPWSNEPLTFVMPGQVGEYYAPTERWAAYVDQATGFGVGVYTPVSDQLVAYRIGPEGTTARSDVSYMAPLVTARIQPNTEFSYDAYLAAGRVDEMRAWFADIAGSVQAAADTTPYIRAVAPPPADAAARVPAVRREFLMDGTASRSETRSGDGSVTFVGTLPTPAALVVDSHLASPKPERVKLGQKPADLKPKARKAPPLVKPWAASPGQPGTSSSGKDKGAASKGSSSSGGDKGSKKAAAAPPPKAPATKLPPKPPAPAVAGKQASKSPQAAAVGVAAVGVAAQPVATQPAAKRARTRHIAGASRSSNSRHDAATAGHRSGPRDPSEPGGRPGADAVITAPRSAPMLAHAGVHPVFLQGSTRVDLPRSSTTTKQATAAATPTAAAAGAPHQQQPKPAAEERKAAVQRPVQQPEVVKRGLAAQPAALELHQQPAGQSHAQASADAKQQQQQQQQRRQEEEDAAFEAAASRTVAAARSWPRYPQGRRSQQYRQPHVQAHVTVQQTADVHLGTQQQQHGRQQHDHHHDHLQQQQQQQQQQLVATASAHGAGHDDASEQQRLVQLFSAAATTLINKASSSEAWDLGRVLGNLYQALRS